MKQILVFDLGGVLIENDMFSALQTLMVKVPTLTDAAIKARWLASEAAREFELGLCSPEHFGRAIVSEFELSITPQAFLRAFAHWPKGLSPKALELLADLRDRQQIACLSNSNEVHWTDALTQPFDKAYSSHLITRIKPDEEAFEYVTTDLGVAANQVVFFDDSQPNVDAANAFGWQAHLTVGLDELSRVLAELGV